MKNFILVAFIFISVPTIHGANYRSELRKNNIFIFHTDEFWLNLHHFLYVLGRAENKTRDTSRAAVVNAPADQEQGMAKLTPEEQTIWRDAVKTYASTLSRKDIVFDAPLPELTNALAQTGNDVSLKDARIDSSIAITLEKAAPIYRKAWWPAHRQANRRWQMTIQKLVDRHGRKVLQFITGVYEMKWAAAGFPIHLSAYSNWAGAYSIVGSVLVVSSLNADTNGIYGLETIFHEGMHQWDDQIDVALKKEADKLNKKVPDGLSHALIFFTAGEAIRHVVPQHVPYAEKYGVWQRGLQRFKSIIEQTWKPYLDGHGTRDEAFAKLIQLSST